VNHICGQTIDSEGLKTLIGEIQHG